MIRNKEMYNKIKYLYYEKDLSQKEIAQMLGMSRQWISRILNSDSNHERLKMKKKQNRNIERRVEFYKNSVAKVSIPRYALEFIGVNEKNRNVVIKISRNKLTIELRENKETDLFS